MLSNFIKRGKMKAKNIFKLIFGLLFVLVIFYYVGFDKIFSAFKNFKLIYLLAIPPFVFLSYLGGVYSLYILVRASGFGLGFWNLFKYYLLSLATGMLTPGRIGEFSMLYFLRKESIPLGQGAAISFLDKFISFIAVSITALVALFVFVIPKNLILGLVLVLSFVFFVAVFFFFSEKGRYLIRRYLLRSYSIHFEGFSKLLFFLLKNKPQVLLINFFVSVTKWFSLAFMSYFIFLGLGVYVNPLYIFLITNFCAVVTLIPITFNGLGFVELSILFFYSKLNVPKEVILSQDLIVVPIPYAFLLLVLVVFIEEFKYVKKVFKEEFKV